MSKLKDVLTSERTRENLWKITEYIANGVGIAIPIVAVVLREKKRKQETYEVDLLAEIFSTADYDSAVASIMNSSMFDSRKVQAIELLKKDQQQTYYKAVISIVNLWKITEYIANGVGIAIPIVAVVLREKKRKQETYEVDLLAEIFSTADYDSAVASIMNSSMFDSRKVQAIELLKKDQQQTYYKAVISIVNSTMFDSRKVEAIEKLNSNQ